MPFEFTCPFCHHHTKVDDRFAGHSGPCVSCSREVVMPRYNERGMLEVAVHPKKNDRTVAVSGMAYTKKRKLVPLLIILSFCFTAIFGLVLTAVLVWPSLQKRAVFSAQGQDIDNMKLIAKALNAYSDRYGTYPPPIVYSTGGRPLYSWRVLILPYLGYEDLYNSFQLDQSYDSPANLALMSRMPSEFASPNSDGGMSHQTNYALVVGPGTLFPPSGPMSPKNIDDPTLLLVETRHGSCSWSEPGDIDVTRGLKAGSQPMKDLGGLHREAFTAVSTAEEGFRIPNSVPANVLDSMVSPKGGERVDTKPFQEN